MSVNQPAYGPLPPEGGRVGFIGIPSEGRGNPRGNTGNYVHGYAARHILGEHVNISPRKLTDAMVEEYRASLIHLAFVTATTLAVDNSHIEPHEEHADRIERLGLPVVVFGLGSRAPIGQSLKEVAVHPATVRLLKVLSYHTSTIAVRGAFTADLCRQLGIHNVEVIGCQSCYMSCRPDFHTGYPLQHFHLHTLLLRGAASARGNAFPSPGNRAIIARRLFPVPHSACRRTRRPARGQVRPNLAKPFAPVGGTTDHAFGIEERGQGPVSQSGPSELQQPKSLNT
ncbi:MAG: hypothetical protein O9328_01665 [Rhodobacteraceae bacterium]|nr:hypothetical protein [Paracoccaceae bacterium]